MGHDDRPNENDQRFGGCEEAYKLVPPESGIT
jgi:hypothetical protein